jgi:glutamyl-tRNA reductase
VTAARSGPPSRTPARRRPKLAALIAEAAALPVAQVAPQLHHLSGPEALRYAFAVAASLESQIVGEPQVLAQVKDAHRLAARAGMLGTELDAVFRSALQTGKKVRSEPRSRRNRSRWRPVSSRSAARCSATCRRSTR